PNTPSTASTPPPCSCMGEVLPMCPERCVTYVSGRSSRWAYRTDDIRWNARFVDIIEALPYGTRTIGYGRFLAVEDAARR
ncbi:MAG TPA: hypothetical protein VHS33_03280, partial [Sphingomicrobium sp.]|nr:hypothetical protein [Sphingomicrobium sp.]